MFRVYFDTNVFSNLESNSNSLYNRLNEALSAYKPNLSFFFSPAHIRDKRKADERKISYFQFMEIFVRDNHISYHQLDKQTSFYLATPMMVYNDDEPDYSVFKSLEKKDGDNETLATIKTIFENTPLPFDTNKFNEVQEEYKELFSKMLPLNIDNPTMYDLMEHQLQFSMEMTNNSKVYGELRNYIFEKFNNGKYDVRNETVDFNEAFKDSSFQKTFIQFVKDSMHHTDKTRIPYYEFLIHSYNMLDIFGISKDKMKPRNGFNNILNDAMHSCYATHCDYFVTEDKGLTEKSKALYNLYNIHTQVVSVNDFLEILPNIGSDTEKDNSHFFDKFQRDVVEGKKLEPTILSDGNLSTPIEITEKYLNFFDEMEQVTLPSGELYFMLNKSEPYYLSSPNFREQEAIVNKCIHFWGIDLNQFGFFNFETEIKQIKNNNWIGRLWKFGKILFYLHKNSGSNKFSLQIGPFNTQNAS